MEELHKQVVTLQRNFRDRLDDAGHAAARELDKAIQRLEDDIQVKKNLRSIEDQIKRVIQMLQNADGKGFMDDGHIGDFKDRLESMRRTVQAMM